MQNKVNCSARTICV